MNNDTCESRGSLVTVVILGIAFFLVMVAGISTIFVYIVWIKFGKINQEDFKYVIILFIVCVTVILICGTVIVISANEISLKRKKLNMLKSVLSSGVLTTDDIYKTFADAVSEV